jgi:hypothetical protein
MHRCAKTGASATKQKERAMTMNLTALYVFAATLILTSGSALAQTPLGYCLGNDSPACRLQRQMEEQERRNRLRHDEMMEEMRWQEMRRRNDSQPNIQFPRIDGPFR